MKATGEFDVALTPQTDEAFIAGRLTIDKQYRGDLSADGKGQMLSAQTNTEGSAGYVAIEQVSGTLHGLSGSFTLQHSGTMNRGEGELSIHVVPDSGTEELAGLSGTMSLNIVNGKHFYEFDYTIERDDNS